MGLAVLRASGAKFDARFFASTQAIECDAVWRAGDCRLGETPHKESGFNLTVAEADQPFEVTRRAAAWLNERRGLVEALRASGATAHLDIALFLSAERPTQSVQFDPAFTVLCAELGLTLEVSAYASGG